MVAYLCTLFFGCYQLLPVADLARGWWQFSPQRKRKERMNEGQPELVLDNRTLAESVAEVSRELLVRDHVYPKLVAAGKLSPAEAGRRMKALTQARWFLEDYAKRTPVHLPTTTG